MHKLIPYLTISLVMLLFQSRICAQELDHVQGEVLVKMRSNIDIADFVYQMNHFRTVSVVVEQNRDVVPTLNIHALTFDNNRFSLYDVIDVLMSQPEVEVAQANHIVKKRSTVPNDVLFAEQWQYINTGQLQGSVIGADLDMDLAWDVTTGGLTPLGDTIVVCVIDDGLNPDHMDFEDNLWYNYGEIPDNGVDDDGNGYVDDFIGWDVDDNDGDPLTTRPFDSHGTPVAGIIGAKGNNGIGVSGVNWNVKLMIVRNNSTTEADVLASYDYPLTMRKLYNASNGQSGAFVVATNSSWGIDMGQPAEAPLWCAMYDSMGVHGILSAGATANENFNIDAVGDLPTACPSEYLIAVTNVDETDTKVTRAGFGAMTIDLGAYGENTFTVETPDDYGEFGGTSGATPHVTGAIALLYSAPCDVLANLALTNPSAAALWVRQSILDGTTSNASLDGITVTGGRLNVNDALWNLLLGCGPCPSIVGLKATGAFPNALTISWTNNDSTEQVEVQYRRVDVSAWTTTVTTGQTYAINDLDVCSDYEIRVRSLCSDDTSNYTNPIVAKTDGCCDIPIDVELDDVGEDFIDVSWKDVFSATEFQLRIREQGSATWSDYLTPQNSYTFTGVNLCSVYEIQIKSLCSDSSSVYSQSLFVSTPGCGGCLDLPYCEVEPANTQFEFINSFAIGAFENESGDNDGYGDFTAMTLPHVERQKTYSIHIIPGLNDEVELDENYIVWIDFNSDGEFSTNERALAMESKDSSGVSADVTIPANAILGSTRMRVGMRFSRDPNACEANTIFGEYEDYCLTIDENSGVSNTNGSDETAFRFYPNPVFDRISFSVTDYSIAQGQLSLFDQSGKLVTRLEIDLQNNDEKSLDVSHLPAGIYIIHYIAADRPYQLTRKLIKL